MSSSQSGFTVLKPGMLTLLQDSGRFGFHRMGLSNGGPLDVESFIWANRLCTNDSAATALEVTMGGLVITAQVDTYFAVTGADLTVKLNGKEKSLWCCHPIKSGDQLEFGFARTGCRCYLAVAGGFIIDPVFNSTATVPREAIGGIAGRALQPGDGLPCKSVATHTLWRLAEQYRPSHPATINVRLIPGYQYKHFSKIQQQRFFNADFQLTTRCDRMGYCLQGPAINADIDGILSEGISCGAVQILADGQPIILLNDRQTIGGYPKIGAVISVDIPLLAQATPGATISFKKISVADAQLLLRQRQRALAQIPLQRVS